MAQDAGSNLAQEVTATDPADGGTLALESVASFDPAGGEAIFEPGASAEERFSYGGLNANGNYLMGVTRPNPLAHPVGSFVSAVQHAASEPTPTPSGEASPTEPASPAPSPNSDPQGSEEPEETTPAESDGASTQAEGGTQEAGEVPDPCTILFGTEDCVAGVLELVGGVECDESCQRVLDAVENACGPIASRAAGIPPAEQCIAMVDALLDVVIATVCGPEDVVTCTSQRLNEITDLVLGLIDSVCNDAEYATQGAEECLRMGQERVGDVLLIMDGYYRMLCGDQPQITCANEKLNDILDIVMALIDSVCNDSEYATQGVEECVRMGQAQVDEALRIIDGYYRMLCGDQPQITCANEKLNDVIYIIMALIDSVCNDSAYGTSGPEECTGMIIEGATKTVYDTCGTYNTSGCEQKLIDLVNALIDTICNDSSSGTSGSSECVPMVQKIIDDAIVLLYRTICPNTAPGVADMCYQEVVARANAIVDTYCNDKVYGTQGSAECANMVVETAESLIDTICNDSSSGTAGSSECVPMVQKIIDDAIVLLYRTICPNTAPGVADMCYQEIVARANAIVDTYCNDSVYGTQGSAECTNMVVETAESLIDTICNDSSSGTSGSSECVPMVQKIIDDAIVLLYRTICPNTAPGVADMCYQEVVARANAIVDTYCNDKVYGTQGVNECANMVAEVVVGLVDQACNDSESSTTGEDECVGMLYDALCPNSSYGVADMCYEEIRARILAAIPSTCVTLGLLCEPIPEVCDQAVDPSCVPPPPDDLLIDPCASPAGSTSATDTSPSPTFPASTTSNSFDPPAEREEGSPLPMPASVSRPPVSGLPADRSTFSSYPFALARMETLVERYDALVTLVSSLETSSAKARDLLDSAPAAPAGSPDVLADALAELDALVASIEGVTEESSSALSTVPDVDAGLQQSYSAASAGIDPTEDPFYRALSDLSTDAAFQVLGLGSYSRVVINGCAVRGLEPLAESPEFGPYASQLLAVIEMIDAEVLTPIQGFKGLVVEQTVEAPGSGLATADDSAPPAEQQLPTAQQGAGGCTYSPKADGYSWYIFGTSGNDQCVGSGGDDTFYMKDGDDQVWGFAGDDLFYLGDGADYVDGGDGHDRVYAGRGDDVIWGHAGLDSISAEGGEDEFHGGSGEDWADLGSNSAGGAPDPVKDLFWGGAGNDIFHHGFGNSEGYGGDHADGFIDNSDDPSGDREEFYAGFGRDWGDLFDTDVFDAFWGQEGNDSCPEHEKPQEVPVPGEEDVPGDWVELRPDEGPRGPECGQGS